MAQLSLFDESASGTTLPRDLLDYVPGVFSPEESRAYLETFVRDTPWVQWIIQLYYRDGNDSVAWHTDNDGIPGRNRIVASISFGQSRRFDIRKTRPYPARSW
jgi:alkylated DNA repair dioxygenase AlkB